MTSGAHHWYPSTTPSTAITIQIRTETSTTDWKIHSPDEVTFNDGLQMISQVMPDVTVNAFEYEDEDGDRITVRSHDEMKAMLSYYLCSILDRNGAHVQPLVIYPKVRRKPVLTVQTSQAEVPVEMMEQDGSRKRSGDIREILACGSVREDQLQIVTSLGSGNCGTVYKAFHKPDQTIMAVKVIPLDITRDVQKQIIAELEALHKCHSPVIISFYGAFFLENQIFICTEFMDGGSLDKYKHVPEQILGPISVSVVRGLQYLWSLKIMHRDVKPSNILVNTQGEIKICDFGVSVQLIDSIAKTFIGTNAYMAPERITGQDYSIHSEVWSLGVSLFELAIGHFPYQSAKTPGAKDIDLLRSIVDKDPPRLPHGMFSNEFVDFVTQCMQKTPSLRPAPEALLRHPFVQKYVDYNMALVAEWAQGRMMMMTDQL